MGEPIITQKSLEDAILKALETHFSRNLGTANNARSDFYNKFQRAADDHDRDFVKKNGGDLDTTLIFAGLFSAVASAFIIQVQAQIQPDYTQLSYDVLMAFATANSLKVAAKPGSDSPWTGPDPNLVHIQCILYSSLAVSLLSAFAAMLGKQWLNRYSADIHGSLIDRSRDRQRKMNGMATWRFNIVMESLPMMLQGALLLLGYALYSYLATIDSVVAWVIAGFTASGLLFYALIVVAAILSYDCPFQTPISIFVHFIFPPDNRHRKSLKKSYGWFQRMFSRERRKQRRPGPGGPYHLGGSGKVDGNNPGDQIELTMFGPYEISPPLLEKEADWDGYVLDSNCITWMSEKIVDEDAVRDIMKFIPEVVWHPGIRTTPLKTLYDTLVECFDYSSGNPVVTSKLKQKAYLSAKALLHIAIQRRCIDLESDKAVFDSISSRHQFMGPKNFRGDSDLESTLGIIDRVFKAKGFAEMPWDKFSFSDSHHSWMGHILLYRAWYVLRKGEPLPDDIREFVLYSLRLDPPPSASTVLHCLLIIGLVLKIELDAHDQQAVDKSEKFHSQMDRIYEKLVTTFENTKATPNEIDHALEALRLIAPLSEDYIATKSYDLFHAVMKAPLSPTYTEEKKWEASRLALHGAYKWDKALPWVENPQHILTFLSHHFQLAAQGTNQDEPIQNALRALAYASTTEVLKNFDPTQPSFVRGIRHVFKKGKPLRLRKAALFFLPHIGDKWFNTHAPIMKPEQMKVLCEDWASAVDDAGLTSPQVQRAALTVLFAMINSSHWRQHIVKEKWKLLEHFASVPDDSEHLRRCLENPELVHDISAVGNREATVLWSTILWLKFTKLIPEVQVQLVEVAKTAPRSDIEMYLRVINSEWTDAEDALTKYTTWDTDAEAVALREKIDNLKDARDFLAGLKNKKG